MSWSIASKAADRSKRTEAATLQLSLEDRILFAILATAVSVDWQRLKPD